MQIMIEIPDGIASQLSNDSEKLTRRSLELLAVAAYRKGLIGSGGVRQMLGFDSRWETYDFLAAEDADPALSMADIERDQVALDRLLS